MPSLFLTITVPIATLILGALLTHYLSRASDTRKTLSSFRVQAYVDYLRCVAESAHINRNNAALLSNLNARATDAKTRICIYGTPEVIEALAEFGIAGATTDNTDGRNKLVRLHQIMRSESGYRSGPSDQESLEIILFGAKVGDAN